MLGEAFKVKETFLNLGKITVPVVLRQTSLYVLCSRQLLLVQIYFVHTLVSFQIVKDDKKLLESKEETKNDKKENSSLENI